VTRSLAPTPAGRAAVWVVRCGPAQDGASPRPAGWLARRQSRLPRQSGWLDGLGRGSRRPALRASAFSFRIVQLLHPPLPARGCTGVPAPARTRPSHRLTPMPEMLAGKIALLPAPKTSRGSKATLVESEAPSGDAQPVRHPPSPPVEGQVLAHHGGSLKLTGIEVEGVARDYSDCGIAQGKI